MNQVVFTIKRHGTKLPIYKKKGDAGIDLRCGKHFYIREGRNRVPNGICFNLPENTEGQVRPRSGNSVNGMPVVTIDMFFAKCGVSYYKWVSTENHSGKSIYEAIEEFVDEHSEVEFEESELIRIDADVELGTVDSNYIGEVCTTIINRSNGTYIIPQNTRISQFVISPVVTASLVEGDVNKETERGSAGFNSTGVM